jgi:hypothetical protein
LAPKKLCQLSRTPALQAESGHQLSEPTKKMDTKLLAEIHLSERHFADKHSVVNQLVDEQIVAVEQ